MRLRSSLGRARGLGSAKDGTAHFWAQRLTAVALIPLVIWFSASMVALAGADHATVVDWLSAPIPSGTMMLVLGVGLYHLKLGLQVVIEDYIHGAALKLTLQIIVTFATIAIGLAVILALLKLFLGG